MNIRMALSHRTLDTWDRAKKYNGDKNNENGILSNLTVDTESILTNLLLKGKMIAGNVSL
jgi:hypothetical protein